jgi:MoxR-like ATPase
MSPPEVDELLALLNRLLENIGSVVLGKPEVIKLAVVALLAEGHILIEDVPGVGKTLLARALAASIDCSFRRIQFTPDLLPSDILGSSVYNAATGEFVFKQGPVFANVILADEINRTTPRTQSALLEAMSDCQVSVEGKTYPLEPPFIVLATQNPYEFEGTYVLPESQLDRFMIRLRMGYPVRSEERRVLASHRAGEPVDSLAPVLTGDDVLALQRAVRKVRVDEAIADYLLDIVHATRKGEDLHVGVSTRGALTLYRAAQSLALVSGREFVVPDDVKSLAVPVLAHRVVGKSFLQAGEFGAAEAIIRDLVDRLRVPS